MAAEQQRLVRLHSRARIAARVRALARTIRADYQGRELVVVGVLKGAFVFVADLVRALDRPVTVDFVGLSSYGAGTTSGGTVTVTRPLQLPIAGRDVLVVEDILDTGLSMQALLDYLHARAPRSVRICALVDKRERRLAPLTAHYVGFTIAEGFVVGYGIDLAEQYRHLPDLYTVAPGERP